MAVLSGWRPIQGHCRPIAARRHQASIDHHPGAWPSLCAALVRSRGQRSCVDLATTTTATTAGSMMMGYVFKRCAADHRLRRLRLLVVLLLPLCSSRSTCMRRSWRFASSRSAMAMDSCRATTVAREAAAVDAAPDRSLPPLAEGTLSTASLAHRVRRRTQTWSMACLATRRHSRRCCTALPCSCCQGTLSSSSDLLWHRDVALVCERVASRQGRATRHTRTCLA